MQSFKLNENMEWSRHLGSGLRVHVCLCVCVCVGGGAAVAVAAAESLEHWSCMNVGSVK